MTYVDSTKREIYKTGNFRHVIQVKRDQQGGITCKIHPLFMPTLCVSGRLMRRTDV